MNIKNLVKNYKLPHPVYVTQPTLPDLGEFKIYLEEVWESKWLTNSGKFHQVLENKLNSYLGSENCSLFCNGTMALLLALKALDLTEGEVITTPFTFPATLHVLSWNNLTPVFCDINEKTFNIDADQIEKHITEKTKAILPVHVFGYPCDVEKISELAEKHQLKVVYDAAHAFGVKLNNRPVTDWGDLSMLSFHATKHFNTLEGGALITKSPELKKKIDLLKNFGIADEENVVFPGINGKMNELQAAYGILQLEMVDNEVEKRKTITELYRENLKDVPGIGLSIDNPMVEHNYSSFPILVNEKEFGENRSTLYEELKKFNVFSRKYFYPLCSDYPCYSHLPSARKENLSIAKKVSESVLCLPLYGNLALEILDQISFIIKKIYNNRHG